MGYIGNSYNQQAIQPVTDFFSGNGVTTTFQLTRPVSSNYQIEVVVNNVQQNPANAYTINNQNQLVLTGAPSTGTQNIYVMYNAVVAQLNQPGQGTVNTQQLGNVSNIASGPANFTLQVGGNNSTTITVVSSTQAVVMSTTAGIGTTPEANVKLHLQSPAIVSTATSLGWPNYINPESDANARTVAVIETAGNGSVATAGTGGYPIIRLGNYYDSRAVITMTGGGGAGPSDQSTASGKDLMVKAGTSDNTNGRSGGRLWLNGGAGYNGGVFGPLGYYGDVRIQGGGGNTFIGRNDAYGGVYGNLYLPFKYNDTGEWAPMKGTGWIHLGSFTHRDGSRYLDIKTNNNAGSLMFMFHVWGYLYNSANLNSWIGGYSYTTNSILNNYVQNLGNCTATTYRTSTNNYLCVKIDRNNSGYSEGKVNLFFHAWSQGEMENIAVTSYAQNNTVGNYYTS